MPERHVLNKWIEYLKTLREDLSVQTISEARDGFYAGVIAGLSLSEKGNADSFILDEVEAECREYIQMLQAKLDELTKRTN